MSNELMIPVSELPDFNDFLKIVTIGFEGLGVRKNQITVGVTLGVGPDLLEQVLCVCDHDSGFVCWISFCYFPPEVREEAEMDLPYVAGFSAKGEGNLKFLTVVAGVVAKSQGRVVYDDGYMLKKQEVYSVEELKLMACSAFNELYGK
ncbi:hypothetical protein HA052_03695 [Chromobacterium haemolyticum]|uniref:Uncharacterized protein n=1 Tax=Chromobacterium fluminis TaxID=3044269 RepID=A0ABX0L5F8_9NEIS|nr:hypothetical protein [Chromobacterium haemolyticum]NHR04293.1 hypothetical protein [Chromobacterium haemolyticum]